MYGKKRGFLLNLEILVEILLAVGILLLAISWVNGEVKDSKFHKEFYSKDVALVADAAHAAPGQLNYAYEARTRFDLDVGVEPGRVVVLDRENHIKEELFATDSDIAVEETRLPLKKISIVKENATLKFRSFK